jgi:hypothetical protein
MEEVAEGCPARQARPSRQRLTAAALAALAALIAGCSDDDAASTAATGTTAAASTTTIATTSTTVSATSTSAAADDVTEPALREELLVMFQEDQDERTGRSTENNDRERADRLTEIVAEHGWPTHSMVGTDGGTAAWLIAQHADFDVEYQEQMLELLTAAVDADEADASEMAYLVDRVAVNNGEPQVYGTQIGGCGTDGPVPGEIADEATVDDRRAEVDLAPLADYLAELAEMCAAES